MSNLAISSKKKATPSLNAAVWCALTQFLTEVLILPTQLLVLFVEGSALALGTTLLWCQRVQDPCGTLMPPRRQMRGVQALAPEQGANAAGLLFSLVGSCMWRS